MLNPDSETRLAVGREANDLVEDHFAKWGDSIAHTLKHKGFKPEGMISHLVSFTKSVSILPDISALTVDAFAHQLPILRVTLFGSGNAIDLYNQLEDESTAFGKAVLANWGVDISWASSVYTPHVDDIVEELKDANDEWVFIGGIHFRSIPYDPKVLPQPGNGI